MITLAFDTATDVTAVAAVRDGDVLGRVSDRPLPDARLRHGVVLLASIEEVVDRVGGWSVIGRIAVGTGPGTYTGLRIGLATAAGLAAGTGVETVGISTLAGLAAASAGDPSRVAAVIDAKRDEVFAALYAARTHGLELLAGPVVVDPASVAGSLGSPASGVVAVGNGAVRYREELGAQGFEVPDPGSELHEVSAVELAILGERVEAPSRSRPEPHYLRQPDAKRWRERDAAPGGAAGE